MPTHYLSLRPPAAAPQAVNLRANLLSHFPAQLKVARHTAVELQLVSGMPLSCAVSSRPLTCDACCLAPCQFHAGNPGCDAGSILHAEALHPTCRGCCGRPVCSAQRSARPSL